MRALSLHLFFFSTCSIFSITIHSVNEFLNCVLFLSTLNREWSASFQVAFHATFIPVLLFWLPKPRIDAENSAHFAPQWINWEGRTKFHWTKVASSSLPVQELGQYHMHSSRQRGDITCAEKHVIVDEDVSSSFGCGKRGALPVTKKSVSQNFSTLSFVYLK